MMGEATGVGIQLAFDVVDEPMAASNQRRTRCRYPGKIDLFGDDRITQCVDDMSTFQRFVNKGSLGATHPINVLVDYPRQHFSSCPVQTSVHSSSTGHRHDHTPGIPPDPRVQSIPVRT